MTILQALNRYYDRMAAKVEAVPPGYVNQIVGYALILSKTGEVLDVRPLGTNENRKIKGFSMVVPAPVVIPKARTAGSIVPYFLWDKPSYLLGVETGETNTKKKYTASRALHLGALAGAASSVLLAVRSFYERYENGVPSELIPVEFRDRPYVFRTESLREFAHDTDEAKRIWAEIEPRQE